jgi:hypothetical protein
LTSLGRAMEKTIIVDNSPHSYAFQPQNALPCGSFIDDPKDNDLLDMLPYLHELSKGPSPRFPNPGTPFAHTRLTLFSYSKSRRRGGDAGGKQRVRPAAVVFFAGAARAARPTVQVVYKVSENGEK